MWDGRLGWSRSPSGTARRWISKSAARHAAPIDFGFSRIDGPDGKPVTAGDADYDSCREVAGRITPVPCGIGPVTAAIRMRSTLIALRRQK